MVRHDASIVAVYRTKYRTKAAQQEPCEVLGWLDTLSTE
jgi:hypothetical protein